jgi:hypothetical protein
MFKITLSDLGRECVMSDGSTGRVVEYYPPYTIKNAFMCRIFLPSFDKCIYCEQDGRTDYNYTHRKTGDTGLSLPKVVGWKEKRVKITKAHVGKLFLSVKGNICEVLFVSANQEDGVHPVTAVEYPSEKVFHLSEEGRWINHLYTSELDFDCWIPGTLGQKTLDGKQAIIDGKTYELILKK